MKIQHPTVKIYVAIPCYTGKITYTLASSLLRTHFLCNQLGWDFSVKFIPNDCILHSVRNKFVSDFMGTDCTHLFFIDDDVAFDPKGFEEVVKADKEICCGIVPLKHDAGFAVDVMGGSDDLLEIDGIGAAFMCIKRRVIEKMKKKYPELKCETFSTTTDGYSFFEFTRNGKLIGEDITFCKRWRELGQIWAVPDIDFNHGGCTGNYAKQALPTLTRSDT